MAVDQFEKFLSESFTEGIYYRELRLSQHEVERLKVIYPYAQVERKTENDPVYHKAWYDIKLFFNNKPIGEESVEAIRNENVQLKRELEALKKSND